MAMGNTREHIFISYAGEDWALAEWLTLKLTAEGYRVWCDRFELLGGESYPRDIDDAIKNRTFRLVALLSRASLSKPNPVKERTLALNISRERGIDFLIPLNVDNIRPTELDWMTSDLTYIPFYEGWAEGLEKLLKKLVSVGTPRPLKNGKQIAAETFFPSRVIAYHQEILHANFLTFERIPEIIKYFRFNYRLSIGEKQYLSRNWAFHPTDQKTVLSFHSPPTDLPKALTPTRAGGLCWLDVADIEGIRTINVVTALLNKSIQVKCLEKGLKLSEDLEMLYFHRGLLEKDTIYFLSCSGTKTRVLVTGERTFGTKGPFPQKYHYHLSPRFRVRRDLVEGFVMQLRVRLYLTDTKGQPLQPRTALSRRKRICRSWWNHAWLNRHLAICHFLADGRETITIGDFPSEQIVLSSGLVQCKAPLGINEKSLSRPPAMIDAIEPRLVDLG